MGAAASVIDQSERELPKPKVTRKVNSYRVQKVSSPKKKRRPSFFDDRLKSDNEEDLDDAPVDSTDSNGMKKATRRILVKAVEEFLAVNGTQLRSNVIDLVVNSMNPLVLYRGQPVIRQGEIGSFVYVIETGNLSVTVNGEEQESIPCGKLFGELALLFDARRSATVTCTEKCKLWSLNRTAFKLIQRNATNLAIKQRMRRFQVVQELAMLPSTALAKLVTSLTPMSYKYGDHLYTAGKCTTKVMLIEEGSVIILVPQALQHLSQEEIDKAIGIYRPNTLEQKKQGKGLELGTITSFSITEGCVIGMRILLGKIGSLAGWTWVDAKVEGKPYVGAMPPISAVAEGVVKTAFFTVYRFEKILGSTKDFYDSYQELLNHAVKSKSSPFDIPASQDPDSIKTPFISDSKYNLDFFDTIEPIHSIHMGYFALGTRVNSTGVSFYQKDVTKYVLKRLFKSSVVLSNQVKHVLDEAKILEELNSPFILCMLGKFQTCDELVFVFEIVPSGDLWSLIHERDELRDAEGFLSVEITRFYIANIILALEHMHVKNIAYRNLKPENILMGADGYVKISGMAFAKIVPFMTSQGSLRVTSFTFCGTLEYLAPEMVLNSGHDQGLDKWALGVLMYEMLTGTTPFERSSTRALTEANLLSHKTPSQRKLRRPKSDNLIQVLSGSSSVVDESSRTSGKMRESVGVMKKCSSLNASISSDQQDNISACQSPRGYLDMDILDALLPRGPGDTEDEGTICSHYSWNASKGEVHRDSNASIKSDGSDGFRADDNHHDANRSLRGDDASALLATIASLKTTGVDLPEDLSDLECSKAIISLLMQLLNTDPVERPEIRRSYANNIFDAGFFTDFDWAALAEHRMLSPFIPPQSHTAFMDSKFSKRSIGCPYTGDDSIFLEF